MVIGVDFSVYVGEGNRGNEEIMSKCTMKEKHGRTDGDGFFTKRMEMSVVNISKRGRKTE